MDSKKLTDQEIEQVNLWLEQVPDFSKYPDLIKEFKAELGKIFWELGCQLSGLDRLNERETYLLVCLLAKVDPIIKLPIGMRITPITQHNDVESVQAH